MNNLLLLIAGICIGILFNHICFLFVCKIIGTLNIDTTNEDKDIYTLNVDIPLESLSRYKTVRLRIAHKTSPNMNT